MGKDVGLEELLEAHKYECTANLVRWTAWMVLMIGPFACKPAVGGPAQTAALYQKACDGGEMGSCINLGFCYEQGTGVGKDAAKAAALYQKACDDGDLRGQLHALSNWLLRNFRYYARLL